MKKYRRVSKRIWAATNILYKYLKQCDEYHRNAFLHPFSGSLFAP